MGYENIVKGDHIDLNILNNQRENLRLATKSENGRNAKLSSNNKSGHRNVFWEARRKKWLVSIYVNKKTIFIGYYDRKEQAIYDYQLAAKFYYREFARFDT
jgi:hypothetical protein